VFLRLAHREEVLILNQEECDVWRKESIMTFATILMNRTNVPVLPARSRLVIRKALVAAGLAGALTAGAVAFPGMASAQTSPSHTSLMESASQPFPAWCPFGTHGGDGGGCRGGSIANGVRKHAPTAAGCALAGGAAGLANPVVGVAADAGCQILLESDPAR